MQLTSDHIEYINGVLRFTERQIQINTGHAVKLSLLRRVDTPKEGTDPERLIEIITEALEMPLNHIKNGGRKRELIMAKQIICYILKQTSPKLSYDAIGLFFDQDHSSVLHNVRTANNRLDSREETFMKLYAKAWNAVDNYLNQVQTNEQA